MARFKSAEEREAIIAEIVAEGDQSDDNSEVKASGGDEGSQVEDKAPEPVQGSQKEPIKPSGQTASPKPVPGIKPEHLSEYDPNSKIPAPRWDKVLDERNALRRKVKELEARSHQSPARASGNKASQDTDDLYAQIDRELSGQDVPGGEQGKPSGQSAYESRLEQIEVYLELQKLQGEVAEVRKQYPDVPSEVFFGVLKAAGDRADEVDLMEIAERYEAKMESEFEVRAKKRGINLPTQQAAGTPAPSTPAPQAAPRPKPTGSGSQPGDRAGDDVNLADPKARREYARRLANSYKG